MMGVGLQPLEFADCLADTPQFRENLHRHEKELEKTSQQIKRLIKEVKDVVQAARRLRSAQLALASSMEQLEGSGADDESSLSEDERAISRALGHFAHLLRNVEDERDRMLENAQMQIIEPLERFRKEHVGAVKEGKKKFDKKTSKFNQTQERTLALSTKKPDGVWVEAEAAMEMASRDFCAASLRYVCQLQALQRRRHFEVGEALLGFVFSWWTFHHTVHEMRADAEPLARDTQLRIQRARGNFEESSKQTESLMKKMMEIRSSSSEEDGSDENGNKSGYLFLMEKKAFGTTWSRQYASFDSSIRVITLTPYNQNNPKDNDNGTSDGESLRMVVAEAKVPMDAERRFCMEVTNGQANNTPLLLQAPSERARASWLKTMNHETSICASLEAKWVKFINSLFEQIERRGLNEQGLYRVGGVRSRVLRMLSLGNEGRPVPEEADVRTLTSAVKAYLRSLPEPLLTQKLHREWCYAARLPNGEKMAAVRALINRLPKENRCVLFALVRHLRVVVSNASINLMTSGNIAVCVGAALLPHDGDSMAAVNDVKTYNSLLELMVEHAPMLFHDEEMPPPPPPPPSEDIATPSLPLHHGSRTDISPRYGASHLCLVRQLGHSHSSSSSPSPPPRRGARVRTLYACLGESEGELSFEPNQVISNVAPSAEPGWLRGELAGRVGLVPENYVEPLP